MNLLSFAFWIAAVSSGQTQHINQPNYAPAPRAANTSVCVSEFHFIQAPTTLAQLMPTPVSTAVPRQQKNLNRQQKTHSRNNLALMKRPSTALTLVNQS